jgi:hypothetical protein
MGGKPANLVSFLQNSLWNMKKRQGTTLVVPHRAKHDSGFSRGGVVNNWKQDRRG